MLLQSVNQRKMSINLTLSEISEETQGSAIERNFFIPVFVSIRKTDFTKLIRLTHLNK